MISQVEWIERAHEQAKRFWSKVNKTESCWLWTKCKDKDGYGKFAITAPPGVQPKQKHVRAHRLSWEMVNGEAPSTLVIMHSCDTPACVNPAHLSLGSQAQNRADCGAKGREPVGERHHSAKIDVATVRRVRELSVGGMGPIRIAAKLGIGTGSACGIVYGRTWTSVA